MKDDSGLEEELRAVADWLDRRVRPVDPATVTGAAGVRRPARRPHGPVLAAAAAVVVLVAGAAVLAGRWQADIQVGTGRPPAASDPTDAGRSAGQDSSGSSWHGPGFSELPASGVALAEDDELVLFDHAGVELARTTTPAAAQLRTGSDRMLAAVRPGEHVDAIRADIADAPDGCGPATTGGGVRVALCGGTVQQRRYVELVTPTGERRVLAEPRAGTNGRGHWRSAVPSPDGQWVLATWSGECEIPTAFVLSTGAGGRPHSVDGADDRSSAVESVGVGWTPEGRAIVHFLSGSCGSGSEQPGTYLVDPATLQRSLLIASPAPGTSVHTWRLEPYGNTAERIFAGTLAALGLQGCCSEPSHGGAGLTSGARWEGFDIPVGATPADDPPAVPFNDTVSYSEPIDIDGAPAVAGEADLGRFVAYTCGGRVWTFGGAGIGGDRPTDDAVRALAASVLPHLGCTVEDRPQAPGHPTTPQSRPRP